MKRKDREIKERVDVINIIKKAKILHLGINDIDSPYVVPLHYGFEYNADDIIFYVHSAKEGRKIDLIKRNSRVCVELDCDMKIISGGEIPCKYGSKYSSVIAKGEAKIVKDLHEKVKGLDLLMINQVGRKFEINEQMASQVEVIKIVVDSFTAKACRI